MAACAAQRPDLLAAVFLVDGMTSPIHIPRYVAYFRAVESFNMAHNALKRRDVWPSAEAARRALRASPFFAVWDERQFDVLVSHGLVPVDYADPAGPVTLATPAWCEALLFVEPFSTGQTWDALPAISVPVGWCMAGDSATTRGDLLTQEMVWRPPRSRNERVLGSGHLIVQENPDAVGHSLWRFLCTLDAGEWDVQDTHLQSRL